MSSGSQKRKLTGPDSYTDNVWKRTKGTVNNKLENARPYRLFLSAIDSDSSTHTEDLTLSFPGIYLNFILNTYRYLILFLPIIVPIVTIQSAIKLILISFILELLDKSLGELAESLHINFMVELGWLFAQYFITDQR